jgi:protein O-GlcNAc transferase
VKKIHKKFLEPSQQQLNSLLELYQTGKYPDAEKLSVSITEEFPKHQFAWKVLGAALNQIGKINESLVATQKSVQLNPQDAEAHNNLGNTLKELGRLDEAEASYRQAITLKPDLAEAQYNLGITLTKLGRLNEAEISLRKAIALKPDLAGAHFNLGIILNELGRLEEAITNYGQAITLKPDLAEAHNNLGNALKELRRLDEAETSYRQAITLKPDLAEAHNNLGNTLKELGRLKEAEISYRQAIELKPDYAEAHSNLGNTLKGLDRYEEAEASYRKAIVLKPNLAEAHYNLGNKPKELRRLDESESSYRQAITLKPDYTEAHNNLGIILKELGRLKEAEISYRQAIELKPDYAEAHSNLGNTLKKLDRYEEAEASYKRAITLKPNMDFLFGSWINTKMHLCMWGDLSSNLDKLIKRVNNKNKVITPFHLLSLIDEPSIHRKAAEISSKNMFPKLGIFPKISFYHNHKKIRIGYFSPDFKNHPVSYLAAELYEIHDRSKFEIHAFSFGPDTKDELNIRIKAGVDYFHDVQMRSDQDIVKLSRSLEIDIAIDLTGFTGKARTNIFAMSAAPLQVNYLGYPGTMAIDYIDYLIADHIVIPNEKKIHYSEKIVFMPNSYQPNNSRFEVLKIDVIKKNFGLPSNGFIFCSFNNQSKISPSTFAGWMRILKATNNSILWLYVVNVNAAKNLKKEAKQFGINEDRLIFAQNILHKDHLKRIQLADLFLDTLPYNGHTTTSEALKMGLPVLTSIGSSFASRVSASLLTAVNLSEMITSTQEEYETLAIQLATHPEKLKVIKDKLVQNLPTAPLFNTKLYTLNLEAAYQIMYKRYQDGLDPDDIEINVE